MDPYTQPVVPKDRADICVDFGLQTLARIGKVILIDGKRLADLMIEYQIGASTIRTITLKRLGSETFNDE